MVGSKGERVGKRQNTYVVCHEYKHEEERNENRRAVQAGAQDSSSQRNSRSEEGVSITYWSYIKCTPHRLSALAEPVPINKGSFSAAALSLSDS